MTEGRVGTGMYYSREEILMKAVWSFCWETLGHLFITGYFLKNHPLCCRIGYASTLSFKKTSHVCWLWSNSAQNPRNPTIIWKDAILFYCHFQSSRYLFIYLFRGKTFFFFLEGFANAMARHRRDICYSYYFSVLDRVGWYNQYTV